MGSSHTGEGYPVASLVDRLHPGTLWGHSTRGLVWNPVFALAPLFYLNRFLGASSGLAEAFWLAAFLLGFPHAAYTALEIRHYTMSRDGTADERTRAQLLFFSMYGLLGSVLAVWYIERGASALAERSGFDHHLLMCCLALAGSVGAVMGLQDVLVIDILLRPLKVARAGIATLFSRRWSRLTLPWALAQWSLAEALHAFV